MTHQIRIYLAALFLIASLSYAAAQTSPATKPTPAKSPAADKNAADKNNADKSKAARDEAKRLEAQRRATATALLISVADEARSYRNQTLRARIQARAADILWETDAERARTLFRRAWEAADTADAESQRRFEEERRALQKEGKSWSGSVPPSLRTEVLRMAAKRDRALGEEFLGKLDEARKQEAANVSTQPINPNDDEVDPFELPAALKLRLRLASQLLESDVPRAIEFAEPALARVSVEGLLFLTYLRAKNAEAADERYAGMLMRAMADPTSDANTVSLLSSYIFTPFVFIRHTPDGSTNSSQYDQGRPAPDVPAELRAAFFRVAEHIFLRPLPPPEQDRTTSGRTGKYMIMARLMPHFEQYASEETTRLLKAQMQALSPEVPENYRRESDRTATRSPDEGEEEDSIESILAQVERAKNQEERDDLYTRAALLTSQKGEARAIDFSDKISETELRKSVRGYVDFSLLRFYVEKKRMEDALPLARKGSLSSMQRIWAFIEIARSFIKKDRETAIEALDEAQAEARRIGSSSADRTRALTAVATILYELERPRAWDLMSEVVRTANNTADEFSGEDTRIIASLRSRTQNSMYTFTAAEFDLPGVFRSLARENLDRAILLAKDFNGESPRAISLIAITSATLEKKDK
jgi:hypothetical protein